MCIGILTIQNKPDDEFLMWKLIVINIIIFIFIIFIVVILQY